eukprot:GHVQ01002459.1.p1 GENE.GHVQ01002459.1~~GHVQ01002459.1.p1  ORF type:complete len:123 (+),score=13.84 GHVQ01002459.1:398-766(+)
MLIFIRQVLLPRRHSFLHVAILSTVRLHPSYRLILSYDTRALEHASTHTDLRASCIHKHQRTNRQTYSYEHAHTHTNTNTHKSTLDSTRCTHPHTSSQATVANPSKNNPYKDNVSGTSPHPL